jgi:hypothetical protein
MWVSALLRFPLVCMPVHRLFQMYVRLPVCFLGWSIIASGHNRNTEVTCYHSNLKRVIPNIQATQVFRLGSKFQTVSHDSTRLFVGSVKPFPTRLFVGSVLHGRVFVTMPSFHACLRFNYLSTTLFTLSSSLPPTPSTPWKIRPPLPSPSPSPSPLIIHIPLSPSPWKFSLLLISHFLYIRSGIFGRENFYSLRPKISVPKYL